MTRSLIAAFQAIAFLCLVSLESYLAESISAQLATEPGQCRLHADELMRRLEAEWPTLLRRIQYRPGR